MRKSKAAAVVARRLNLSPGRVDALVQSVSDAGLLPKAIGKHYTDLQPAELATLLLAVVADRGLGGAGQSVREFAALESDTGHTLQSALTRLLSHVPALSSAVTGSLVLRLEPASVSMTLAAPTLDTALSHRPTALASMSSCPAAPWQPSVSSSVVIHHRKPTP